MLVEVNFDALVGPTHHFGGLGVGNVASQAHAHRVSSPRQAALEGLKKASLVASLGIPQFLLFPPVRPNLDWLCRLGFQGSLQEQLTEAFQRAPHILSAAFSSAFMWAANSATVSAAADTADGRTHMTPANLISSWHRASEAGERASELSRLFAHDGAFTLHPALPAIVPLRDEGAANHMRLSAGDGWKACNVFVFGADEASDVRSGFFPRQSRAACEAIARQHQLHPARTFFLQQHPEAIAAGVFHNDVIATSHENLLIHHERAFLAGNAALSKLELALRQVSGVEPIRIAVSERELPLSDAVRSYFFNSQIVTPGREYGGANRPRMVLISPSQCREIETARRLIERLLQDDQIPIDEVHFVTLDQSMAGGGGPACLRLRVPMDVAGLGDLARHAQLDSGLAERLQAAIEKYYPATLAFHDLCDPACVEALLQVPARLLQAKTSARASS